MRVTRHAEEALVALTHRLPMPASVIVNRLKREEAPAGTAALEVASLQLILGDDNPELTKRQASNGDMVVVIVKDGGAITAMLRRSWNQPFTPEALHVDEVRRWAWNAERREWTR